MDAEGGWGAPIFLLHPTKSYIQATAREVSEGSRQESKVARWQTVLEPQLYIAAAKAKEIAQN